MKKLFGSLFGSRGDRAGGTPPATTRESVESPFEKAIRIKRAELEKAIQEKGDQSPLADLAREELAELIKRQGVAHRQAEPFSGQNTDKIVPGVIEASLKPRSGAIDFASGPTSFLPAEPPVQAPNVERGRSKVDLNVLADDAERIFNLNILNFSREDMTGGTSMSNMQDRMIRVATAYHKYFKAWAGAPSKTAEDTIVFLRLQKQCIAFANSVISAEGGLFSDLPGKKDHYVPSDETEDGRGMSAQEFHDWIDGLGKK
jgi:hypothetical protein